MVFYICPEENFCEECRDAFTSEGHCSICTIENEEDRANRISFGDVSEKAIPTYHSAAPIDIVSFLPDSLIHDWRDFGDTILQEIESLKGYFLAVPMGWWIGIGLSIAFLPVLRIRLRDIEDEW